MGLFKLGTRPNLGTKQLEIREQEFYRQGVLAVAVRKQILQPGEITDVFIISRLGG
ncbi:TraK domain-containing protein [Neisseria meningitidis]|uniref:TraK domain-containing protein n=1 Tax=Neisseria meningitidis TaxID=487 RepID=UPI001E5C5E19|nr:type-F conjugative transfer system secretin TraK [Neisseria meningitidis]